MELSRAFRNIGFDDKETEIYLYILENGPVGQQEISDSKQIVRQTVYDIMKRMQSKGFVSLSKEGKKKVYSAVSPEIILSRIREEQEEFEKQIPYLNTIRKEKKEVYIESFIGMKGLRNLFSLTLRSNTEIFWAMNYKSNEVIFKDYYWQGYASKRVEKKISIKLLLETGVHRTEANYTDPKAYREVHHTSLLHDTNCSIVLFEDKIILYTTEKDNLFGVFIKNQALKDFLERMFLNIWDAYK